MELEVQKYKVKSVHQNVSGNHGFKKCQLLVFHEISEHDTASKPGCSCFLDKQDYATYREKGPFGLQFWECNKIAKPLAWP